MTGFGHGKAQATTPTNLFKRHLSGAWDMDDALHKAVEQRGRELWEAAGSPEGHELTYRFRAEQEMENFSEAGEEDPFVAVADASSVAP